MACERKFKVCVPDTPQSEKDASETVVTRLEQHLWAVYEEHCVAAQIKNMLKRVRVDVQEHADDKPLVAKITRTRKRSRSRRNRWRTRRSLRHSPSSPCRGGLAAGGGMKA